MHPAVRLVFVLHDHQPVGNFHDVIEDAYQKSYLPFLDLLQQHPTMSTWHCGVGHTGSKD